MRTMLLLWAVLLSGLVFPALAQDSVENDVPNLLEQLEQAKPAAPSSPVMQPALPTDPSLKKAEKLPYKSYDEIPEEAIIEALKVADECKADQLLSTYYDCDCRGMRFLEKRLIRGPNASQQAVEMDIGAECPNLPAIAGASYQTCIGRGISYFPARHDPEAYCSCLGNAYAKLYEQSGRSINMRLMIKMETIAALSCTNQEPGVPRLVAPIQ